MATKKDQGRPEEQTVKPQPVPVTAANRRQLKLFWYVALGFCILAGSLLVAFYLQLKSLNDYAVPPRAEPYTLEAGMNARDVISDLAGDNFNQAVIWAYVKLNQDKFSKIQKGRYLINGTLSVAELLRQMSQGKIMEVKPFTVTLVEGMNVAMVEKRLQAASDLDFDAASCFSRPASFIKHTLTQEQLDFIGGEKDTLEGLLLPATYPYFKDDGARAIVARALRSMVLLLMREWPQRADKKTLADPYQALILASIVERESAIASEQVQIAGVFYNRLKKGMRLQTDPAVMYGVSPDFRGPLRQSHLKQDGPYNTYTRVGLPPTPIAMPSASAVRAVLHPSSTNALYFVAKSYDPRDGHNFANSLKEHNRNVAAYKRSVRQYKRAQQEQK